MARRLSASLVPEQGGGDNHLRLKLDIVAILFCLSTAVGFADEAQVTDVPSAAPSAELDQAFLLLPSFDIEKINPATSIRVGDAIPLKLQGDLKSLPPDLKISLPAGSEDISTTIDLADHVEGEDRHFSATAVKSGDVTLPSLVLSEASGKAVARTNPFGLVIQSAISKDDPKPKEAEPPLPPTGLGLPLATLIVMGLAILLLLGAGVYGIVRWSRNRKLRAPEKPKAPPLPEDQIAIQALERLEKSGYIRTAQFKAHYFGISEILKHYLGSRYHFDAAESTTDELLMHLERESGASRDVVEKLREIYEKLDLVKFTDHRPSLVEGNDLLAEAKKIILSTRRPPEIVSPGVAASNVSKGARK
jgi:hypothetical protein